MKPLHLTSAAAVLLVAALVAFLWMPEGERGGARRSGAHEAGARAGRPDVRDADASAAETPGAALASEVPDAPAEETGPISITLKIVGPDDAPASGADVVLDRGIDALRAKADGIGVLRLQDFAPGVYDLRARHGNLAGALRFEAKGALDLGTLRLAASVTVAGHVYGPRGEPVPNALVDARRSVERQALHLVAGNALRVPQPDEAVARTATGVDGAYALLLPAGEAYALRATARGLAPANREPSLFAADAAGVDLHLKDGVPLEGRVVDAKEAPLEGARVLLMPGRPDAPAPAAETVSGADGSFAMTAEAGGHVLTVLAAGHARFQCPVTAPRTDLLVVLGEGVSLRLEAVDGDRSGVPAAGVSVAAMCPGGCAAGVTDDRGRVLLENLALDARMTRGQSLHLWGGGYAPLEISLAGAQPVAGVVDLGVVGLARGGAIEGRVFDRTTGAPIGGARVGAFGGRNGEIAPYRMATGVSAQDGSFRLEGVPLDAHTLTATHPGFVDEALLFLAGGGVGGPRLFAGGGREIVRNVELVPAESITGVVLAPDGAPVEEANVHAVEDDPARVARLLGAKLPAAKSDAQGAFAMRRFCRGQRTSLSAHHADYGPSEAVVAVTGELATLRLTEPLTIEGSVADPGGAPIAGVRVEGSGRVATTDASGAFVLRDVRKGRVWVGFDHPRYLPAGIEAKVTGSVDLGRVSLFPGGTIAGSVVHADGRPAGSVVVHAAREPARRAPGRTAASAVSDAKGEFEIRGLAEGPYKLRTSDPGTWSAEVTAQSGARDARIVLLRAGKLPGRVTAGGTGVAGASVRAEQRGVTLGWARSAADGTFELVSVPPESPFDVVVEHESHRTLRAERVTASERLRTFALEPGAEVSGSVVDGRGDVIAGAEVLVRVDGRDSRRVVTDAAGEFTARGLDEGRISLRVGPGGWTDVAPGARNLRIVVAGESISGVVRHAAGRPARRATVLAVDAEGGTAATTWVWRDDGAFELRGLPAGTYTLRAKDGAAEGEVAGVEAGAKGLEIRLGP